MDKNPWFAWIDRDYWFEKEKKRMLAWGYTPEQIEQHIKEILEKEEAIEQKKKQRQQEIAEMMESVIMGAFAIGSIILKNAIKSLPPSINTASA